MIISNDPIIFPCGMSRSGTTLLATILDSHSKVSMGYELIPPPLPSSSQLVNILQIGMELGGGNFLKCGRELRKTEFSKEGLFFTRCYRAGLDADAMQRVLLRMRKKLHDATIDTFRDRLYAAWMIAVESASQGGYKRYGFKLNIPSVTKAHEFFPNSRLVYILRDPRDVVASHIQSGFDRTIPEICTAWCNYINAFAAFAQNRPSVALVVRYEDLVSDPKSVLPNMLSVLNLSSEESVFEFHRSKAGIHTRGHPNAENLKKGFFISSISRWEKELEPAQIHEIEKLCGDVMKQFGFRYKIQ
jgi:hypothetical protein